MKTFEYPFRKVYRVAQKVVSRYPERMNTTLGPGGLSGYTVDGKHCLVGQVLHELGVDLPPTNSPVNFHVVSRAAIEQGWDLDNLAIAFLSQAQRVADGGEFWKMAFIEACEKVGTPKRLEAVK